jgi:pimeloyl-ACP methyl ester carboxylesterase
MGALVSIEVARRYPRAVRSLVLCSPPLYDDSKRRRIANRDQQLKRAYELAARRPKDLIRAGEIAKRYGLIDCAFDLSEGKHRSYVAALRALIINQTSLRDIATLTLPITIVYGKLDPFVVGARIRRLKKRQGNIKTIAFTGGHEINSRYRRVLSLVAAKLSDC